MYNSRRLVCRHISILLILFGTLSSRFLLALCSLSPWLALPFDSGEVYRLFTQALGVLIVTSANHTYDRLILVLGVGLACWFSNVATVIKDLPRVVVQMSVRVQGVVVSSATSMAGRGEYF